MCIRDRHTRLGHPAYPPLLAAIAEGTFGLMKRPPERGKGLDGVEVKADDYVNPAGALLEEGSTR